MSGFAEQLKQFLFPASNESGNGNGSARPGKRQSSGPRWAEQDVNIFDKSASPPPAPERTLRKGGSKMSPYYVWGSLAFLMAGFAIGLVLWQRTLSKPEDQPQTVSQIPDPLLSLQEPAKTALLDPEPELAAGLKRVFSGNPDTLCKQLDGLGLENRGWVKAPFQRDRWQCASNLVPLTTPSVDFGSTTLFFLLRGPSEDKIDYLRLKLVVEDKRQKQIGLDAVWLVIDALSERYGWTVPAHFRDAIAAFTKLETTHRGVQLSVAPEDPNLTGDPLAGQRLNIILNFGEPDLIRPSDRFEKVPPLESGWSVTDPGSEPAE